MPELPEVETALRGIKPHLKNQRIKSAVVRHRKLRFPVTPGLEKEICGATIKDLTRRGKYLLISADKGTLIIHLGMSGNVRILESNTPTVKHNHFDLLLDNGDMLRFCDTRKFGVILWTTENPMTHKLLASLGLEPLDKSFNGRYLYEKTRRRSAAIKNVIMDSKIVVGIGNIYASESLYVAGIRPTTCANQISEKRLDRLVDSIRKILKKAIKQGGTTLNDFVQADGNPGYFKQSLKVYGRSGEPCFHCKHSIIRLAIGKRSSYYCPNCQH